MSTPVTAADTVKLRAYSTMGNQASVTTFHYIPTPAGIIGTWTTDLLALVWGTLVGPLLKGQQQVVSHYDGCSCQVVTVKPYSSVVYSNAQAGNGTVSGNPLPTQVSGICTRLSAQSGRAYRGRIYFPFPSITHSDTNGIPTLGYQSLLTTFISDVEPPPGLILTSGGNTITLLPVLKHKNPALPLTLITGHAFPLKWATQRRRGDYGRPNFKPSGL